MISIVFAIQVVRIVDKDNVSVVSIDHVVECVQAWLGIRDQGRRCCRSRRRRFTEANTRG